MEIKKFSNDIITLDQHHSSSKENIELPKDENKEVLVLLIKKISLLELIITFPKQPRRYFGTKFEKITRLSDII